jgi:hypothetical protein
MERPVMRSRPALFIAVSAALALVPALSRAAPAGDSTSYNKTLCMRHIVEAERREAIPARLLGAVALAESGRPNVGGSAIVAWPWTVMAEGTGRYFETKAEAVAEVAKLRARGVRNIDVGCMQINLMYHPEAFPSIEAALDPARNVAYGAELLKSLRQSAGGWSQAVAQYHTQDQARGRAYMARVLRIWGSPAAREAVSVADAAPDAKPKPLEGASAASLVARAAAADGKPSSGIRLDQRPAARPWTDVVRGRTKFAEWLARRQDERRSGGPAAAEAEQDPS